MVEDEDLQLKLASLPNLTEGEEGGAKYMYGKVQSNAKKAVLHQMIDKAVEGANKLLQDGVKLGKKEDKNLAKINKGSGLKGPAKASKEYTRAINREIKENIALGKLEKNIYAAKVVADFIENPAETTVYFNAWLSENDL